MIRIVISSLVLLGGCESCSWTYGDISIGGVVTVIGAAPSDLTVRVCDGPDGSSCDDYPQVLVPIAGKASYSATLPAEGVFTCGYPKRWLVFTATGCDTVAFGTLSHDAIDEAITQAASVDLEGYDATIVCCPEGTRRSSSGGCPDDVRSERQVDPD